MAGHEVFIAWKKAEIDRLKQQIESMESGKMRRLSRGPGEPWADTTDRELEDCKNRLAQLEILIERLEPNPDGGIRPEDLNSENDG